MSARDRVAALSDDAQKIMEIGGTAGLSLGILHHGEPIYHANFGFRDVEKRLVPDANTIYFCCSLTKALSAAAVGLLVDENKVTWDTLVTDAVPEFNIKDDPLHTYTTVADLLCHRTDMAWADNLYISTNNNVLISSKDSL
jgi:CubicO group peptidase (beta-lactamase class C family)